MAQLASCPQCKHELLLPDESDGEAWAKCPECRAFFQVKQATLREVREILLVEPDAQDTDAKSAPTISYSSPEEPPEPADVESTILMDGPQASGDIEAAAKRIDEWFRSAKTLPDAALIGADEAGPSGDGAENHLANEDASLTDATIDPSAGRHDDMVSSAEFELGDAIEPLQSPAAWDDPHHMDQLFADVDGSEADELAAAEVPSMERATSSDHSPTIEESAVDFAPQVVSKRQGTGRRKRSPVRTIVMAAVAGVIGLVLGGYALLWISGPSGDILHVAGFLPQAILPPSFKTESQQVAINAQPQTIPAEVEPLDDPQTVADTPAETADNRAEVQASFTDEPAAATVPTVGDRYAGAANDTESPPTVEEPAPLDAPIADALPDTTETTEPVRIANAPSFTSDDLRTSFESAKTAQPDLIKGNFTDSKQVAQAKGYSYSMLADLAQKVSFVEGGPQTTEAQPLQQESEELFRQTLADPHTRAEVAVILPKWIGSPNRKHGGVFFAAKPAGQENKGSVIECRMELDDGQAITVLAPAAIAERRLDSARPLAIVGWIVDRPAEQVTGYKGNASQAIWASRLIPLD